MLFTVAISLSTLTIQAAIVLAVATFVLLIASRRRPLRDTFLTDSHQGDPTEMVRVARLAPPRYKRPNPVRRLVSLGLSGLLGVLIGTVTAIMVSIVFALVVVQLTSMLR